MTTKQDPCLYGRCVTIDDFIMLEDLFMCLIWVCGGSGCNLKIRHTILIFLSTEQFFSMLQITMLIEVVCFRAMNYGSSLPIVVSRTVSSVFWNMCCHFNWYLINEYKSRSMLIWKVCDYWLFYYVGRSFYVFDLGLWRK